jgi:hypothetical protein
VRTGICIVHQVVWGWRQLLGVAQGLSGLQEIVSRWRPRGRCVIVHTLLPILDMLAFQNVCECVMPCTLQSMADAAEVPRTVSAPPTQLVFPMSTRCIQLVYNSM